MIPKEKLPSFVREAKDLESRLYGILEDYKAIRSMREEAKDEIEELNNFSILAATFEKEKRPANQAYRDLEKLFQTIKKKRSAEELSKYLELAMKKAEYNLELIRDKLNELQYYKQRLAPRVEGLSKKKSLIAGRMKRFRYLSSCSLREKWTVNFEEVRNSVRAVQDRFDISYSTLCKVPTMDMFDEQLKDLLKITDEYLAKIDEEILSIEEQRNEFYRVLDSLSNIYEELDQKYEELFSLLGEASQFQYERRGVKRKYEKFKKVCKSLRERKKFTANDFCRELQRAHELARQTMSAIEELSDRLKSAQR
jgi:chromosome segregation ATPase